MPTYLVTGGCGFIGSHLCVALRANGATVRVLDDLSTGTTRNLPPKTDFIQADVLDAGAVRMAMDGVDGCFHLAAIASVARGVEDWRGTHRVNLTGAITVFDAARPLPGRPAVPVIYASSAAVYGANTALPLDESAVTQPLSAYGADKLGCELHARVAGTVYGVPTLGLRFFNVFGPRQDPRSPYSGVISIFCDRLARGEGLDIFGDGEQTRDFVFVGDVVAALLASVRHAAVTAPVLNVCTGEAISVRRLAAVASGIHGSTTPTIRTNPPRSGEIRHSLGCPARSRQLLGLGAPTSLADGLAATVAWQRSETSADSRDAGFSPG